MKREEELKNIDNSIKRTYFFKRGDGFILACEETEAWGLMRGQGQWARSDFEYLGTSDGKTYKKIISEGSKDKIDLKENIKDLRRSLERYLETLEKLKFDDLLDDDDAKVIRANQLIKDLEAKLDIEENKYKKFTKSLVDKAFNAELEVAKQDKTKPSNRDIDTPGADSSAREKIINQVV